MSRKNDYYKLAVPQSLKTIIPSVLYDFLLQVVSLINGKISLGSGEDNTSSGNIKGTYVNVATPAAPDEVFTIRHELGYIPIGYLVISRELDCADPYIAYTPTPDINTISFGCSSAGPINLKIWIF